MRRRWAWILLAVDVFGVSRRRQAGGRAGGRRARGSGGPAAADGFGSPTATLDQWLFGAGGDAASARQLGEARLKSRIGYIDQVCGLTAAQRKKLDLAGAATSSGSSTGSRRCGDELRLAEDDDPPYPPTARTRLRLSGQ